MGSHSVRIGGSEAFDEIVRPIVLEGINEGLDGRLAAQHDGVVGNWINWTPPSEVRGAADGGFDLGRLPPQWVLLC